MRKYVAPIHNPLVRLKCGANFGIITEKIKKMIYFSLYITIIRRTGR